MDLSLDAGGLVHGGRRVEDADVRGFHERFDPWRARVLLEVAGPGWVVPVGEGYAELRRRLRERYRDRPFTADWAQQGRFPALVLGGAPGPWFAVTVVVVAAVVVVVGATLGAWAGVVAALAWAWPLGRVRGAVTVDAVGVAAGPVWAPRIPWHEVTAIRATPRGRGVVLRVVGPAGVSTARVPASTWPALRARLRRLGGLEPEEAAIDLDETYARWRAWAVGLPWGVLAGAVLGGLFATDPFVVWTWGGLAAAGLGLVGAAVEARLQGWRTGGIFWMTAAYALVLFAMVLVAVRSVG